MTRIVEVQKQGLKQKILDLNGLDEKDLDVSGFTPDLNQESFLIFKQKLLEYSDKHFLIIGDYDCDGICATAILKKLFEHLNIKVNYYIPSRVKEGYGFNENLARLAGENGIDVILTVDNGIVANNAIKLAYELGVKVMVIDHHEYEVLPDCEAVIHPSLLKEGYQKMCGGGLAALLSMMFYDDPYASVLGGLATLGDMVEVLGFNRYLLKKMLCLLNKGDVHAINLLSGTSHYTYDTLSFKVVPKLNAVSRMGELGNANYVVQYLLSDKELAQKNVSYIENLNDKRRQLTIDMANASLSLINPNDKVIVVESENFMEGLCGLIANRLLGSFSKPVIVLAKENGFLKGSGRSPAGFDLHECLLPFKDEFETFGGHANAVGLSMSNEVYLKLKEYLASVEVPASEDIEIALSLDGYDMSIIEVLDELKPFGTGFKEPMFALELSKSTSFFRIKGKYPKYSFGSSLSAICFDEGKGRYNACHVVGRLNRDGYRKDAISMTIEEFI